MKDPEFNLLDEPWIPVRLLDGSVVEIGLLELLRRTTEIADLANVWYWPLPIAWRLPLMRMSGLIYSMRDCQPKRWPTTSNSGETASISSGGATPSCRLLTCERRKTR